jgi:hypothetical protein
MEVLKLSDEEAARWNELAEEALWGYYGTVFTPEQIEQVKGLFAAGK